MKIKRICCMALTAAAMCSILATGAHAADYKYKTEAPRDYYQSSSYEDVYGSAYNYGGRNVIDYQIPELEYGLFSTTMTGVMERTILPGLQGAVATADGSTYGSDGYYGVSGGGGPLTVLVEAGTGADAGSGAFLPDTSIVSTATQNSSPGYTSIDGMQREDGSIGTLQIPSLDISMKVWEGETDASMEKGLGHYSSTSAWDGNVAVCGHNRGAKYVIGSIKNLESGDLITYTTTYGTRTYAVTMVKTISSSDWSCLQATTDNRITITTCLANQPEKRICVQAVEIG